MRSDLGRLDAEILQIGPFLARMACLVLPGVDLTRCAWRRRRRGDILLGKYREHPMKVFRMAVVAVVIALLASPAYAQMPAMNLLMEKPGKTQDEKDADAAREKAYQDTLKKIPDAKAPADPWGNVRSTDTPKKTEKTADKASARPKTKTGSTAN
jgi:hypothetical protein